MRFSFDVSLKLFSGTIFAAVMTSSALAGDMTVDYIGQQVIPHDYLFQDTTVGGLSSLDYNAETGRFLAICDDRSKINRARFYDLKLDYDSTGFQGWQLVDVKYIKRPDGSLFPKPVFFGKAYVDPEALRLSPDGQTAFWASEGHAKEGVNPLIREMTLEGDYLRDFTIPAKYMVAEDKGVRDNLAFEAMTVTADQKSIMVSTEGPLIQDGEEADVDHGADVRLLQLDIKTGQPIHEYAYSVEPVHKETLPFGNFSVNGVVEILALSESRYIVVERSFSTGAGLSVKLYLADVSHATDVLSLPALKGAEYQAATKELLLDLEGLGIAIDNIEGISFGKTLKDGRRSLILISDNNFRSAQVTQILVFALSGLK
ncbi:Glycerophosphoryl diester phosphodiesterase [hydrothermal vent metagenome]|uniref:Glycerophosphoryl diester phosphodiesterase n=1 Tax=hydrothermal vent metagenome TaxID=652676 RepID=A0A3B0RRX9_9ZZZZ